jgi:hypothetical protein
MNPTGLVVLLLIVIALTVIVGLGAALLMRGGAGPGGATATDDARAEARRRYDRLGGQLVILGPNGDPVVGQALMEAAERHGAAGGQLATARTPRQAMLARDTAVEGLHHIRTARVALGMDPGPELPRTAEQLGAGTVGERREVLIGGERHQAGPGYGERTPYYYPGGRVQGRWVPAGYYSRPWWQSALASGAGALGGMLLFEGLFGGESF